jgi:hypothetical protein
MIVGARRGWCPVARIAAIAAVVLLSLAAEAQQFGPAQFAIKDDDGDPITNFSLTVEQVAQVARLPGSVTVGNPRAISRCTSSTISTVRSAARRPTTSTL